MNHHILNKFVFFRWYRLILHTRYHLKRGALSAVFFLATGLSGNVLCLATESLPSLPTGQSLEDNTALQKKTIAKTADFSQLLDEHGFELENVRSSGLVPPIFAVNLPSDLFTLPTASKTSLFIRLLIPHVVSVNDGILQVRKELQHLAGKIGEGKKLNASENEWLVDLAKDYSGDVNNLDDLLSRVDIIPNALVLAQAIDESGWGTSHFAIAGNALYGEHLPAQSKGKFIATPGGNVRVAAFDSIYHGTANYVHNLNSTKAYRELREDRRQSRASKNNLSGHELAGSLAAYSALGEKYVHTLRSIITRYRLDAFDNARIDNTSSGLLVEFTRK